MKKLPSLKFNLLGAIGFMLVCSNLLLFDVTHADIRTRAIVTVYSEGKVMAGYQAINKGYMDDRCYVFMIRKGARDLEVRVCGTFTVESVR